MKGWRRFTAGAILMTMLGSASAGWAQLPITNVTVPVPVTPYANVILNVNHQPTPPGYQRPVEKPFDMFGLMPATASGTCAQVTSTYMAVLTGSGQYKVFTYKQGYTPPPDVIAGRRVKLNYRLLDNGLLQVIGVHTIDNGKMPVSGVAVPDSPDIPNVNVKPANTGH